MKTATAKISNARISLKHSLVLCKSLKRKKLEKAKKFLEDLLSKKINIKGKYYTKAANKFLELLKTAEANARQKGLNPGRLFLKEIKADKGLRFYRPRSLWHLRRQRRKAVNLTVELEER
ncbi:MAG: uL22 family ribosomal protein [Candidatus Aenigmatarchaeota archaeon]